MSASLQRNSTSHAPRTGFKGNGAKDNRKAPAVGNTVDRDYADTLAAQMSKEKSQHKSGTNASAASSSSSKKKIVTAADALSDDVDMADSVSADDIKKAMKSVESGTDDRSDSRSSSHKSSSSSSSQRKEHKKMGIKKFPGESDDAYKLRLKAEMRRRKHDKKKAVRKDVVQEQFEKAHTEALARKAEKQRLHLERQAAERTAKLEKIAREKEMEGLTNKQRRLMKAKHDAQDAEKASAAAASGEKPQAAKPAPATKAEDKKQQKPAAKSTAPAPPASNKQTSTTIPKTSKPQLAPANPNAQLPKHHAWEEYNLHPAIVRALLIDLKFTAPTPIQQAVLQPAIRDWKDISAAATTGSGKTLAFGIPIVHRLLTLQEAPGWTDPKKIQALILTPTRELALQIVQHLEAVARYASPAIGVTAIVGGISEDKQKRILDKKHPAIVVATPGRLWELIEDAQLTHLSSAYYLRFLVLDEADRMIDTGHFAELERILHFISSHSTAESVRRSKVYRKAVEQFDGFEMLEEDDEAAVPANSKQLPLEESDEGAVEGGEDDQMEVDQEGDGGDQEDEEDEDITAEALKAAAALSKKGSSKPAAKKSSSSSNDIDWSSFLTEEEIFAKQGRKVPKETGFVEEVGQESGDEDEEGEEEGEDAEEDEDEEDAEQDEDEEMEEQEEDDAEEGEDAENEEESEEEEEAAVSSTKTLRRQIFLFSATLMLPSSGREDASKQKFQKGGKHKREPATVLEKLADKIEFQSNTTPFIVDLSTTHQVASTLQEVRAECVTEDKDYMCYYFLVLYPGKTLVFVNSISCLRRLVNILGALKLPVLGLHAEMQQKARLKSLERFKSVDNSILVCTDVAARGLDIPAVPYIIHYQLPRTSEVYIHRSGRVARAGAAGLSLAIIDENDTKNYRRLCLVLKKVDGIPALPIDQGFMTQIRARMHVARQLDQLVNTERKVNSKRDWFLRQAEAMEMEVDEDELQIAKSKAGGEDVMDDDDGITADETIKKGNLQRELDFLLAKPLMHGTLNRKFYTLNAARGFDLNKESAGIAKAGANALEKNGTIRVAQNSAVGSSLTTKQHRALPEMLKMAREKAPVVAAAQEEVTPAPSAPAKKVVVSLSAKRKAPSTEQKPKEQAPAADEEDGTPEAAEPDAEPAQKKAKKQKTKK